MRAVAWLKLLHQPLFGAFYEEYLEGRLVHLTKIIYGLAFHCCKISDRTDVGCRQVQNNRFAWSSRRCWFQPWELWLIFISKDELDSSGKSLNIMTDQDLVLDVLKIDHIALLLVIGYFRKIRSFSVCVFFPSSGPNWNSHRGEKYLRRITFSDKWDYVVSTCIKTGPNLTICLFFWTG